MTNPNKTHKKYQRIFTLFVSLFFVANQISPVSYALPTPEKNYVPTETNTPTKALDETIPSVDSNSVEQAATSQDFLQHELVLEKATLDSNEEKPQETSYEVPEYSYEDAVAHLSSDYAAAVIVNSLTAENLKDLVQKNIEVGVAVLRGKIVLFSSGNGEELRGNSVVKELLSQSTLMAHTHPAGYSAQPSLEDYEAAGDAVEYAIGEQGVFAYNHDGLTSEEPLSYQTLINEVNKQHDAEASTYETRELLHKFIEEIDAYNQDPNNSEKLRAAGPTIFPNQPRLSSFDSTTPLANFAATQLTDASQTDKRIRIVHGTYNAASGSYGGAIMDFSSAPADMSATSTFSFDFRTDNTTAGSCSGGSNCVKVEFVDTSNRVASVFVSNLTTTFQQKDITKAILNTSNPSLDYTHIKQINFVIDYNMVAGKPNGFFEVRTGGLYFQPTFAAGSGPVTNLASFQGAVSEVEPAGHDTSAFFQTSTSEYGFTYNLANGADADFSRWGGAVLSFGNTTPFNINSQDLVLGIKSTQTTKVKFDIVSGTGANAKVTTVIAQGVTGASQFFRISSALIAQAAIPGFDATNITAVYAVVDNNLAGSNTATGTVTIATQNIGSIFKVGPDATNPAITNAPVTSTGARPALTSFVSYDPVNSDYSDASLITFSQTFAQLNYNTYNTTSYAGVFFTYDNPATNDGNAATTSDIETINLNTVFPNGIVFGLDNGGTGTTEANLEVTDINGKKDTVTLTGILGTGQHWKILTSKFDEVDVTKIQSIALVEAGRQVGGRLNIDWGTFAFIPPIPADASNPAITPVPTVPGDLDKPAFVGFASYDPNNVDPTKRDFSNATVTSVSPTFQQLDMNLYNTFSYGGGFVSFDNPVTNDSNPATTSDIETVNFSTTFPNGIVLGLDNGGTDITQAKLEVTDITGKKDTVLLTGIGATGKRWKVLTSQFDEVDLTKIQTISLVVEGRHIGGRLNVDWGTFAAPQASDATNPAIQKLPVTSTGDRPAATAFASQVNPIDNSTDYSNATVTVTSQTFATVDMNLYNTNSFGGIFVSYDNLATNDNNPATTTDIESINLNTIFPNGLVFSLDNGGTDITQASLEVTDVTGKKDSVLLGGIQNFGKRWKVLASQFDDADVTKIQSIALVVNGRHVAGKLNVDWGNFFFVPPIPADGTNPAITFAPLNSQGNRVAASPFSSNNPANSDFSSSTTTMLSATFAQVDVNLYNTNSYGGMFLNYDNAATNDNNAATTTDIETINLSTVFPNGIVLGLDNGGTGLNKVKLEVTDINGKKDAVYLTGIAATGQRYKVLASQFDEVDITKIQTLALVIEGRQVGKRLNVDWGLFDYVPVVNSDASNPAITKVPANSKGERPPLTAFASQVNPVDGSTDFSNASVNLTSPSQGTLTANLYNTNSYGGFTFGYDDPATNDNDASTTTDIESINMNTLYPNGLVLALASNDAALTQVKVEVTDVNGNRDIVILNGLTSFLKRFKISMGLFDQVDVTRIKQISIVVEGRHVGSQLSFDWGDFFYTPSV